MKMFYGFNSNYKHVNMSVFSLCALILLQTLAIKEQSKKTFHNMLLSDATMSECSSIKIRTKKHTREGHNLKV